MRLATLASGSSGNCIYIGSEETHILIDTGISGKRIEAGLHELGLKGEDVSAVFVTHEHIDHVSGLGVFSRKNHVPIYSSQGTFDAAVRIKTLGEIPDGLFHEVQADQSVTVGDMIVSPFQIDHDAAQPLAYRVDQGTHAAAVATDLGCFNAYTLSKLQGLDTILLEANHDIRMLQVGPYPYHLKQRILGNRGHLSNDAAGRLLGQILHGGMKKVLLGHLSKENNYPELAYETVRLELTMGECARPDLDIPIGVAPRDSLSAVIDF